MTQPARPLIAQTIARAVAPRPPMRVSEWAERRRVLSAKASPFPGPWRNHRNPMLVEPMDCMSARSPVREAVCVFPIQFGKTDLELNVLGYTMTEIGGPVMVALPNEVLMNKWVAQKLGPLIDQAEAANDDGMTVADVLTTANSRDSANRRDFKDFVGGQLFVEHAGSPGRLKSTSVRTLIVDEHSTFAGELKTGDDPDEMLDGRNSAFPSTYKRLKVSSPGVRGICRTWALWEKSSRSRYHVACPHCGHEQHLEWAGLQWNSTLTEAWYMCRECAAVIEEHHKPTMIAAGRWVAENPNAAVRGYHANGLYYALGLGPRWLDLARKWVEVQNDPAKLKTFINDRLAEPWEDPATRKVKLNVIADRAEPLPLRPVPHWVLAITVGIDTQDNRLAVQIVGWGRGMVCWPIDYVELPGDPQGEEVWAALVDLLSRPIEHASGAMLRPDAALIDMLGHRTEAVKNFVRQRRINRMVCGFGSNQANSPALGKGKAHDVNWRGQMDKRGVMVYPVGVTAIKHMLYGRLATDAEKTTDERSIRFSDQLDNDYFGGLVSEIWDPKKNAFIKAKGGYRNEPLDTWVYAYAAALHPELRMHRWTKAQWDEREAAIIARAGQDKVDARTAPAAPIQQAPAPAPRPQPQPRRQGIAGRPWDFR